MTHHDDKDWEFGPVFKSNLSIVCTALLLIEIGWMAMLYQGLPRPLLSEKPPLAIESAHERIIPQGRSWVSMPVDNLPPCQEGELCSAAQVEAVPVPDHKKNSHRGLYLPDGSLHIEGTGIVCVGYANGQTQCSVPVGSVAGLTAYNAMGSATISVFAVTGGTVSRIY